jgi:hypothetical protein
VKNKEGSEKDIAEGEKLNMKFYFMGEKERYSFKIR